jgi:2-methylcitrate dehydratase
MDTRQDTVTDGRLVTRELAEWISALRFEDLPAEVVEEAGRALGDFLGETLFVLADKPWGQAIAAFAAADGGCRPEATILATGERTMASKAALANGTGALGFEYADFGAGGRPYPFAVTGPLALAEARHASGRELVLGIVVGYEVMARLGRSMMRPGQPLSNFYVPAVLGTVASAAACAKVLGLSAERTTLALGLGAAFSGGTFQGHEEGAWQRSLNGGMASERGVNAALMAETGFRATEMGLEGVQGFASMYANKTIDVDALLGGLGESFEISNRWVKPFPMNLTLHAPVTALLQVIDEHGITHTDIEKIEAAWQKVEPFLAKHQVSTVVSAQASLPFALAVASVQGKVDVDSFTDETVADPVIQGMVPKTVVYQDTELMAKVTGSMPSRVTVHTTDGRQLTAEVLYPKGNPSNRLTDEELKAKYMNMAVRVLGPDRGEKLYTGARGIAELDDVAELAKLFSPS